MIIRGGENIYPREIEEFLYQLEGVKDVQVAGIPSKKYGEAVGAFIDVYKRQSPDIVLLSKNSACVSNLLAAKPLKKEVFQKETSFFVYNPIYT